jgi:hypothetical protein
MTVSASFSDRTASDQTARSDTERRLELDALRAMFAAERHVEYTQIQNRSSAL